MRRSLLATALATLALCVGLWGCGGAGSAADASKNFVATWEVSGINTNGEETSADDLELLKSLGMSVYLTLDEDGKATFELFGVKVEGGWEATDATTATLRFDDEGADDAGIGVEETIRVGDDGALVLQDDESTMTFVQIDPSDKLTSDLGTLLENADASDPAAAVGEAEEAVSDAASGVVADLSDAQDLDVAIADDDTCAMRAVAKGVYYDDPGFVLRVENRTEGKVTISAGDPFEVGGTTVAGHVDLEVEPGETGEGVLWFASSDLQNGLGSLTEVRGTLEVLDASGEPVQTYEFAA